jgi:bifunctional non-homologous end joining protein LigD
MALAYALQTVVKDNNLDSRQTTLCTLAQEPFGKEGWLYEVKWDGYRIIAFKKGNHVIQHSCADLEYSERYTAVYNADLHLAYKFIALNKCYLTNSISVCVI